MSGEAFAERHHELLGGCAEEGVFVREVPEDRGAAHARLARDLGHAGTRVTAAHEQTHRGLQDAVLGGRLALRRGALVGAVHRAVFSGHFTLQRTNQRIPSVPTLRMVQPALPFQMVALVPPAAPLRIVLPGLPSKYRPTPDL